MSFFSRLLKQIGLHAPGKEGLPVSRNNVLFLAVLTIAALFLCLLVLDGFLFYATVTRTPIPAAKKPSLTSERDIDEVIRLLNERAEKFNAILNAQ